MKNKNHQKWEKEFPKMPDSFHQALSQEVLRQVHKEEEKITRIHHKSGGRGSRRPVMRWGIAAAVVALCGVTAFAAAKFRLTELFGWRITTEKAENLIQTDLDVVQPETTHISAGMREDLDAVEARPELPDKSPLLDIKETLFDGIKLYVYAVPTDNGKNYDLNADRLYVNDAEVGPVSTAHFYPGDTLDNGEAADGELYTFEADLSDLGLTDDFEVSLPLSVYEKSEGQNQAIPDDEADSYIAPVRYQNQDLTFTVSAKQTMMQYPDQTFAEADFTLEITGLTISSTTIKAELYYHMAPELLKACRESAKIVLPPAILSENGEECAFAAASQREQEDGIILTIEYANAGISGEDESFTIKTKIRDYASGEEYMIAAENTVKLR